MTLPLTVLLGYAGGLALAMAAERPLKKSTDPFATRYFAATAIFGGLVLVPAALAEYFVAPDWSLMYLANPAHLPLPMAMLVIVMISAGAPSLGFLVAHRLLARSFDAWCRGQVFLALLGTGVVAIAGRVRIARVTYYESFHYGGPFAPLLGSKLSVALLVLIPVAVGSFVFILSEVRRHANVRLEPVP
ncbi:MAG: hypothetical protein HYV07_00385 [Deltaproteobacteria bacterium]|nr:hypothetical protein [Deltaproteobacteria bacterium]